MCKTFFLITYMCINMYVTQFELLKIESSSDFQFIEINFCSSRSQFLFAFFAFYLGISSVIMSLRNVFQTRSEKALTFAKCRDDTWIKCRSFT